MACIESRRRRVSLYISALMIRLILLNLFYLNWQHLWDLCFVNSECFNDQTTYFSKRHFRSFNVTVTVVLWQSPPGIPFRCHSGILGVWHQLLISPFSTFLAYFSIFKFFLGFRYYFRISIKFSYFSKLFCYFSYFILVFNQFLITFIKEKSNKNQKKHKQFQKYFRKYFLVILDFSKLNLYFSHLISFYLHF
jgi:hypothetical protein